ncbi:alpha/beta fold hydrolase [Pseudonocardia lacus]|uniref:alpha/beta fold hydrolase n=1 Tax=Pseudonocardia lacus TaxID=2835865 RepID=UPI001BDBEB42|nr:alpha/beta fold hydrolase [Pseudonocardia lacus]
MSWSDRSVITTATLELPDGPMGYLRAGDSGPAVVLLHGAALDTAELCWGRLVEPLAERFRVYAPDWPRHGRSRPWSGPTGIDALNRLVVALLDAWGLDRAHLVGLSMGAGVATVVAIDHPDRVDRLVAIAPGGYESRRPAQLLTYAFLRSDRLQRWASRYYADESRLRRSLAGALAAGRATPHFDEIVRLSAAEARAVVAAGESVLDEFQREAYGPWRMRTDLRPRLPELRAPTLLVRGALDRLVPRDPIAGATALIPDSRYVEVPGAAHVVPVDRPDAVLDLIRGFLA